jgi:hypothetical protein
MSIGHNPLYTRPARTSRARYSIGAAMKSTYTSMAAPMNPGINPQSHGESRPPTRRLFSAGPHLPILAARDPTQAGWIALACVLALLSWIFAKRLAGSSNRL